MAGMFLANTLVIAAAGCAWLVEGYSPELYYQLAQEDGAMEWGTFWAFLLAAGVALLGAVRQRKNDATLPWCFLGISLFCFLVAMEEISWGQRVLGYRPPSYFLEHNFQQELNLHNIASTRLRKLMVKSVIGGYGVALPLLLLIPVLRRLARRVRLVSPPTALVPAFAATLVIYAWYPLRFSGEIAELMLGLSFLFAMLIRVRDVLPGPPITPESGSPAAIALSGAIVMGLGLGSASLSLTPSTDPEMLEAARAEIALLKRDLLRIVERRGRELPKRCKVHKRLYTYVKKYHLHELRGLEFSRLAEQGVPRERVEFFLDPWNSPYWFRSRCTRDRERRSTFVYSFGPNRRRDSSKWEIGGDDVGKYLIRIQADEATGR